MNDHILINLNNAANGRYVYEIYKQIIISKKLDCIYSNDSYTIILDEKSLQVVLSEDLFLYVKDDASRTPYLMTANFSQVVSGSYGSVSVIGGSWKIDEAKQTATYHQKEELKQRMVKVGRLENEARNKSILASYHRENKRAPQYMGFKYPPFENNQRVYNLMFLQHGERVFDLINHIIQIEDYQFFIEQIKTAILMLKSLKNVHALGVIHGDVKPENMVFDDKEVRLIDYGFTKKVRAPKVDEKPWRKGTLEYMDVRLLDKSILRADKLSDVYSMMLSIALLLGDRSRFLIKYKDRKNKDVIIEQDKNYPLTDILSQTPDMFKPLVPDITDFIKNCLAVSVDERPSLDETINKFEHILADARTLRKPVVRSIINKVKNKESLDGLTREEAYAFLNSHWVSQCLSNKLNLNEIEQVVDILGPKIISLTKKRREQLKDCGIKPKPETLSIMIQDGFPISKIKMLIECGIEVTPDHVHDFFKRQSFGLKDIEIALLLRKHCVEFEQVHPSKDFLRHYNLFITCFWQEPDKYTPLAIVNLIYRHFWLLENDIQIGSLQHKLPTEGDANWGYMRTHQVYFIGEILSYYGDLHYSSAQPLPQNNIISALLYFFRLREMLLNLNSLPDKTNEQLRGVHFARSQALNSIIAQINGIICESDYDNWKSKLILLKKDKSRHQNIFGANEQVLKLLCTKRRGKYVIKSEVDIQRLEQAAKLYSTHTPKSNPVGFFSESREQTTEHHAPKSPLKSEGAPYNAK